MSTYPTTVDVFANPDAASGNNLNTAGLDHDDQHANANDAIEAIEGFVGIFGAPADATTLVGRVKVLEAAPDGGGTTFYVSNEPYPDTPDVPSPALGDTFWYPGSGDLFRWDGATWVYSGTTQGGGGGGAGNTARTLFSISPGAGGGTYPDSFALTLFQESPVAQTYISVDGATNKLVLEPGVYSVTLYLALSIAAADPPQIAAIESQFSSPEIHSYPGGFTRITDASTAVWITNITGTFYYSTTDMVSLNHSGPYANILNGLVTVTRLRDI